MQFPFTLIREFMKFYVVYGLYWLLYFIGWGVIFKKLLADKSKKLLLALFSIAGLIIPVSVIYLTHDIAVVSYLKDKYCNETMVEIKETVEYPGSVYWEDNVFPGFDLLSRRWMIEHYLDGVHLQTLVLNGDDGKVYLYRATADLFTESKRLQKQADSLEKQAARSIEAGKAAQDEKEKMALTTKGTSLRKQAGELFSQLRAVHDKAVLDVMAKEEVFSRPEDLPLVKYKVNLNQNHLPSWQQRYIYSDTIKIDDQRTGKVIAWSKRIERYKYTLEVDFAGGRLLFETLAGDGKVAYFDDKILFPHINPPRGWFSRTDDLKRVYNSKIERIYYGR